MLVSSTGTFKGPFGFAGAHGYQEDADSGLQLLGHRYYDPSTGRFLTRDPVKEGRNWYGYCENNPLTRVDTDGHKIKWGGKGWTDEEKDKFIFILLVLLDTKSLGKEAEELLFGNQEYEVFHSKQHYWTESAQHQLYIDPNGAGGTYEGKDGKQHPFAAEQAVGHELVHLIDGEHDEQKVVDTKENDLLKEIGLPLRGKYGREKRTSAPSPIWWPPIYPYMP